MALTIQLHQLPETRSLAPRTADAATYRRRRVVAAMVLVLVIVAAVRIVSAAVPSHGVSAVRTAPAGGVGIEAVSPAPATAPVSAAVYVVGPGDTLWSIAQEIAPGQDPRRVVDRLQDRNGRGALTLGQRLILD